jgi:hypothetical protein
LCAELGEAERADALRALLAPHAHHHGVPPLAICYGGPVGFALARLAELSGAEDEAHELYDEALEACRVVGARPTRARVALHAGRSALRRDRRRALALLEESRDAGAALGMRRVKDEAERLLGRAPRA